MLHPELAMLAYYYFIKNMLFSEKWLSGRRFWAKMFFSTTVEQANERRFLISWLNKNNKQKLNNNFFIFDKISVEITYALAHMGLMI